MTALQRLMMENGYSNSVGCQNIVTFGTDHFVYLEDDLSIAWIDEQLAQIRHEEIVESYRNNKAIIYKPKEENKDKPKEDIKENGYEEDDENKQEDKEKEEDYDKEGESTEDNDLTEDDFFQTWATHDKISICSVQSATSFSALTVRRFSIKVLLINFLFFFSLI